MLIAYIDEVGEAGAPISKDRSDSNTSPVFGRVGFITRRAGRQEVTELHIRSGIKDTHRIIARLRAHHEHSGLRRFRPRLLLGAYSLADRHRKRGTLSREDVGVMEIPNPSPGMRQVQFWLNRRFPPHQLLEGCWNPLTGAVINDGSLSPTVP